MRIPPRPLSWVASVLYGAVLLTGLYYDVAGLCPRMAGHLPTVGFVATLAVLFGLEVVERRYDHRRVAVGLLVARVVLIQIVVALDCSGFSRALYLLVPFMAYFIFGRRVSYALAAAYLGAAMLRLSFVPQWYRDAEQVSDLLMFFIGMVFAVSMAAVAVEELASRSRAETLLRDLEASHARLAAYADQVADLAAATERNRLARDIHDSLGHHLTAIAVQLEKASAFRQRDSPAADQAIADARRSARYALEDVRQSVGALRTGGFSLTRALDRLADGVRDTDLAVDLDVTGDESHVAAPAQLALYRAAQEGLTNVRRHAGATRVELTLRLDPAGARLQVVDDGRGFTPGDGLPGFGLRGMRERLELVGGSVEISAAAGGGTRLLVSVPGVADERR